MNFRIANFFFSKSSRCNLNDDELRIIVITRHLMLTSINANDLLSLDSHCQDLMTTETQNEN